MSLTDAEPERMPQEDIEVFERLADRFDGDVGDAFAQIAQSAASADNEESN